jgi:bifunctional DNA-binding transcriptional regulator/antitoxin component of YhaV-PrlF toxin-antitoxin module
MNNILEIKEDQDTGDLYLQFTPDMLSQMGWHEGDMLEWINNGDGSYVIQKKGQDFDIESLDPDERSWYYDGYGVKRKKDER